MNKKRLTIYDIKRIYEEKQKGYFFTHDTMKFFHQTLRSFSIHKIDDNNYYISAPMKDHNNKIMGYTRRNFVVDTGELETIED